MYEYTSFFRDENFLSLLVGIDQAAALKHQRTSTCRHCHAPLRFAGRSPNFLGIVALVDLLNAPNSERRMSDAAKALGLSASTLRRWVRFWQGTVNSKWWRKTLVLRPSLRFPHDLQPGNCDWNKLLFWLKTLAELFMDMSSMMAHSYRPQKTTGAGERA